VSRAASEHAASEHAASEHAGSEPEARLLVARVDADELDLCLRIRHQVFVLEQGVPPALEVDGRDVDCVHFLARSGEEPVGAARLRRVADPGTHGELAKAERVAVLASWRGHGVGRGLMCALEAEARARGFLELWLSAQVGALPFYLRLGYEEIGGRFLEADIEHQKMRRLL